MWQACVCSLSPTLFNLYFGFNNHTRLNTILYTDDRVLIQANEEDFERSVYLLSKLGSECNMEILTLKTNVIE